MQKHNKYFAEDAFNSSNRQLEIYYIRTNQPTTGQSRTPFSARQNIAYLVATFGRDYSRNRLISMIYERKQNDPARRGAGKGRAAGLGQTAGESECR
jgi:hypothetical protein